MHYAKILIVTMVAFLLIDMVWLGFIAKPWYFSSYNRWLNLQNGTLQTVWWAALIVYILFALGIVFMVLPLADYSIFRALLYGAFFGAVVYGVYDFTCLAIFKNWPVGMAFVDWAWGTFLCAVTSMIACYADKWFH